MHPQYQGGVMLAADTLASYGSLARFKDVQRLNAVGEHTVLGAGGEFSDFQAIGEMLEKLNTVRFVRGRRWRQQQWV